MRYQQIHFFNVKEVNKYCNDTYLTYRSEPRSGSKHHETTLADDDAQDVDIPEIQDEIIHFRL